MPNRAVWNAPTELGNQSRPLQRVEVAAEDDLENRLKNLDRLVESTFTALGQETFSGKPHALDLVNDLRVKIKATHNMLQVAKLLSEPARARMFSKVRDSLNELEDVVASHLGVRMN